MTAQPAQKILILGAGLTGLTAAYYLSPHHHVTLLDHPTWQDGFKANGSDKAPILLGCHQATWALLRPLDDDRASNTDRTIPLEFQLPDGRIVAYQSTHLPGALQWMMSLFHFSGLAWSDRWKLFSHVEQIWEQAKSIPADLDNRIAAEWLDSIGQSQEARARIWSPLAQWLTGNQLTHLSAATFVQLLSTVFLGQASDARLTHLTGTMDDRFITPMKRVLEQRGVRILSQRDLPDLRIKQSGVGGVRLYDGTELHADRYIAALSHRALPPLLPERLLARYAYFAQLSDLKVLSEITVHCTGRSTIQPPKLLLLADRPFHQLTTTALKPQAITYELSAIGNDSLTGLSEPQLMDLGKIELHRLYPELTIEEMQTVEVTHDNQAALSLKPGAAGLRPIQQSPVNNLLVAGAWTDTGWPANIESAIVSAKRCAELIVDTRCEPPVRLR